MLSIQMNTFYNMYFHLPILRENNKQISRLKLIDGDKIKKMV